VRNDPGNKNIPIIITSAVGERPIRQQFGDFQAYLRKPFRIDELLETVGRLLAGKDGPD
jgi:CheY-like chemotaxis protein